MTLRFDVAEQFSQRPTLRSVAVATLLEGLHELEPTLRINPDVSVVTHIADSATPSGGGLSAAINLTDCLLRHFANQSTVKWTAQQDRLLAHADASTALPVNIADIGALIDRLALGLLDHYQQALASYWQSCPAGGANCVSRWAWLAQRVRQQLIDGLDATPPRPVNHEARRLLRDIAMYPSRIERQLTVLRQPSQPSPRVCIVRLQINGNASQTMLLAAVVVFSGEQVVEYQLSGRCRSWLSLHDWEQSLGYFAGDQAQGAQVQWTAYEPDDDIFDLLTQAVLENQLAEVQRLKGRQAYDVDSLEHTLAAVTDLCGLFRADDGRPDSSAAMNLERLPLWLKQASDADRLEYSGLMSALAVAQQRANGRSFNDDLPPILEFAAIKLSEEIHKDHPQPLDFQVEHIQIQIGKVVAAMMPGGGQPFASGSVEPVYMTLPEFALANLAGLPAGNVTVHTTGAAPLPEWMTAAYAKQLTVRADIGQAYPDLLKRYLVTDSVEALRRQVLFADQLRYQLPLIALEQKIKGRLSLTGYQTVAALMKTTDAQRHVANQLIVLRPLAFVREPGHRADVAENMFIIGPAEVSTGPHLLYQPLASSPLMEFASWGALLDAIRQPGKLQDSVLVWLSDAARPLYANGGFAQPHTVRFAQGDEFAALQTPAPATLGTQTANEDVLTSLFKANARALIELADRNAISNAESRWMALKEGGWLLLNTLLPLVGGTVANALWLAQLLSSVSQWLALPVNADRRTRSTMLADLLLNISLILLHSVVSVHSLGRWRATLQSRALPEPVASTSVIVHEASSDASLGSTGTLLDFSWSAPVNRLTERQARELESFKIWPSPKLGQQVMTGPHAGLYAYRDKWLAWVGSDLFRVLVDEDGVLVVRFNDTSSTGPRLLRDGQHWRIDLSLRLLGGGPKKTILQKSRENTATIARVIEQVALLDRQEVEMFKRMTGYYKQLKTATGEVRRLFFSRFESDLVELEKVIEQRLALWQELRPGDRPSERALAEELVRLASQMVCFEGLLLQENATIVTHDIAQMHTTPEEQVVMEENVDAYLDMFKALLVNQEKGVHWSQMREALWMRLRAVPKVGEELWREQVLDLHSSNFYTPLEWKAQRMMSVLELCFSRADILETQELKLLKQLRIDKDLHAAFISQAELDKPNQYTLQDRIEVLESALLQYNKGLDIAGFVESSGFAPEQGDYFGQFLSQFNTLRDATETRLIELIHENLEPEAPVIEHVPRVDQPRKKVIRTQNHRAFVGVLREEPGDFPGLVADVRNPLNDQVIASWHQHANGEWVEIQTVLPAAAPAPQPRLAVAGELLKRARELLASVERSIAVAREQSMRAYEPEDMEDILVFKAEKLTDLADQMTRSSTDGRTSAEVSLQLARVASDLRTAAARLQAEGQLIRIAMIKMQPPTAARVSYLHRHNEINIAKVDGRKNLSGSKRNDFVQEYTLRDKDNQLLWWAHFHYGAEDADALAFTAAHLKLPEQRLLGYKALIRAATENRQVVSIYRSVISPEIAQRLFLVLSP
ncbi:MAG TPA: DUF6543 domain-containing protein [Pseudomonas sp.]|jgi:hypothetical protein